MSDRLRTLSAGNPFELGITFVYAFNNARAVEMCLHQQWKSKRLKGEWFELNTTDLSIISNVCEILGGIKTPSSLAESKKSSIRLGQKEEIYAMLDSVYEDEERILTFTELVELGFDRSAASRYRSTWVENNA